MATTQGSEPEGRGGGRGRWLVVVSCFVSALTTGSAGYHTGVLYMAVLDVFQKDVVSTSWLGAIYSCTFALCGPLASFVVNRFDCRVSLVLAGLMHMVGLSSCYFITRFPLLYPALIIAGIGQGLAITGTSVALGYHFPNKNTLVSAIYVCGSGLGVFIHPSLMQLLVDNYGLHGALLIVGAIGLHSIPCGLLMPLSRFELDSKRNRSKCRLRQDANGRFCCACPDVASYIRVLTDMRYLVYLVSIFNISVASSGFYLHLPKFLVLNGYTPLKASFVISLTGVGNILSHLLSGMATLDGTVDKILIHSGINFFAAIAVLLIPVTLGSVTAQFVLAVVYGLYTGGTYALVMPIVLDILGVIHVSTGMGVYLFTLGAGLLAGPPIASVIYVAQSNFHHAFYFIVTLFIVASLSGLCTALFPKQHSDGHSEGTSLSPPTSHDGEVNSPRDHECSVVEAVQLTSSTSSAPTESMLAKVVPDLRGSKEGLTLLENRTDDGGNEMLAEDGANPTLTSETHL